VGLSGLEAARKLVSKPLVAIGGITRDNAQYCFDAGADSVAVIADLFPQPCTREALRDRMIEWRQRIRK
jgi:thiamine-phosphate pyrophosphorylase